MSRKARSLDRSSSTSTENRVRQKSRSKSEPHKSNRGNLIVSNGICNLPDFYSTILGPTADETILVGLETLLKIGFGYNSTRGDLTETTESIASQKISSEENIEDDEYSVGSFKQLESIVYEERKLIVKESEDGEETEPKLRETILSITASNLPESSRKSSISISLDDKEKLIQVNSQQKPDEEVPSRTRKNKISSTSVALDDVLSSKRPSSTESIQKKEELSFSYEIIEKDILIEEKPITEDSVQWIRDIPKPEMIISISREYVDIESPGEIKKEESKMERVEQTTTSEKKLEPRRGSTRSRSLSEEKEISKRGSTRSGSLDKRVLISSLKAVSHEDTTNVEEVVEEEEPISKSPSVLNKFKITIESGNALSEIVVEDKVSPRSSKIEPSRNSIDNYSEKELADSVTSKAGFPTEPSEDRASKVSAQSSHHPSRAGSQATFNIEISKKSSVGSQNASLGRQNVSKMSRDLTSIIPEESDENEDAPEEYDESERVADKQSSLIRSSLSDRRSINESEGGRRSTFESTEIPSINSKLTGDRSRYSKRSSKSFDRPSRGSKQSYETGFDNVKVKISQEIIEEVTEESDDEIVAEPDRSIKSAITEQSSGNVKSIKSKSLISVEISKEIDEDVSEKPEQIKRKSKQSSTSSQKKSKTSVSDTKMRKETTSELIEDTVESDYSLRSKKSDMSRSKRSRNGSLYKISKSTGSSSSKYTDYSSAPVLQLRKSTHDKSSLASVIKSTTSSSKTDNYTCTCNIEGDTEVCQCGDSNSKCACYVCPEKTLPERCPQRPCPFLKPCIKTTVRKSNGICSCCRSMPLEKNIGDDHKSQTLCFDCYTSTSTTETDSEISSKLLQNGVISKGTVRYAITKITEYGKFTTFEIMKSTRKVPKFMPTRLEGVFVLKHKM